MGAKFNMLPVDIFGWKGDPGDDGATPAFSIGTVTTLAAGASATVTIDSASTTTNVILNLGIPAGQNGTGTGDMLAATYDPIIRAITGESTVGAAPDTTLAALWAKPWSEKCILNNPADAFVSPSLPLSRDGTMTTMDFYCTGTPASSTNIVVKQGGTTVGTVAISAAGKTTLTFSTTVTGTLDDLFTYTVGGAGLAACTVLCNQKWVNR